TNGLPTSNFGRVGLDYYRKNPNVVFAVIDCEKIGMGLPPVWLGFGGEAGEGGVKVANVNANGPAGKAGLKVGDGITALDKEAVKNLAALTDAIAGRKAGDKVTLTVLRDKETKDLVVTLEVRPDPGQGPQLPGVLLGLQTEPAEGGLRVAAVTPDGPAAKAG